MGKSQLFPSAKRQTEKAAYTYIFNGREDFFATLLFPKDTHQIIYTQYMIYIYMILLKTDCQKGEYTQIFVALKPKV